MITTSTAKNVEKIKKIISLIIVGVLAVIFLIPIYITVVNVLKTDNQIVSSPMSLPIPPTFEHVEYVFNNPNANLFRLYLNTFIITGIALLVTIGVSSMAAYYTSRTKTKLAEFIYLYLIVGLMIPYQIAFIGVVILLRQFHLVSTFPGIILAFISGNIMFSVFMYHGFMKSLPIELEEAAAIDGAGQFRIFTQILFPLLKPCTATTAIFCGIAMWNDFYTPLIILGGGKSATITLGIYTSIGLFRSSWGNIFTYCFFASLPLVIIYLFAQKQFISGLTAGALKG